LLIAAASIRLAARSVSGWMSCAVTSGASSRDFWAGTVATVPAVLAAAVACWDGALLVELFVAGLRAGLGAEVAFLPMVLGIAVESAVADDADFVAVFFAGAAFVDRAGALAVVFLAGAVFFTAPFALLVVLGVVRFVAEVFAALGADLAALVLPPLDLAAVAGADVLVAPALAVLALGLPALAVLALGLPALAVLGLAAPFVAGLVLPPLAPGVRALAALVLAAPAPVATLAVRVLAAPAPAAASVVRALAVTGFAGLVFVFPPPLEAALLALVLAVATFLVAVAALAALRPRRGCAASIELVARTLVVIPSPSKRFCGTGSTATRRVDRVVPAAAASLRYRPGEPASAASRRRAARLTWSAMSWPALPVLLLDGRSTARASPPLGQKREPQGEQLGMFTTCGRSLGRPLGDTALCHVRVFRNTARGTLACGSQTLIGLKRLPSAHFRPTTGDLL
jgi:hypothetical protein